MTATCGDYLLEDPDPEITKRWIAEAEQDDGLTAAIAEFAWDESLHPRDEKGKFTTNDDGGEKEFDRQAVRAAWVDRITANAVIEKDGTILARMDPRLVQRAADVMVAFEQQAPHMTERITLDYDRVDPGTMAQTGWAPGTDSHTEDPHMVIQFGAGPAENEERFDTSMQISHENGSLSTDSFEGTVWHEIAHAACNLLSADGMLDGVGHWVPGGGSEPRDRWAHDPEESLTLRDTIAAATGMPWKGENIGEDARIAANIRSDLGQYAMASNPRELIAEAYGQYKAPPEGFGASPTARSIGGWLDGLIAEYEQRHAA